MLEILSQFSHIFLSIVDKTQGRAKHVFGFFLSTKQFLWYVCNRVVHVYAKISL